MKQLFNHYVFQLHTFLLFCLYCHTTGVIIYNVSYDYISSTKLTWLVKMKYVLIRLMIGKSVSSFKINCNNYICNLRYFKITTQYIKLLQPYT